MTFRKETTNLAITALLAFGLAVNISVAVLNKDGFGLDFNQFYSGGRLVGTGHLYDLDALRKVELENGYEMPTGRLPVVALRPENSRTSAVRLGPMDMARAEVSQLCWSSPPSGRKPVDYP